jgi:hypothetical protein
MLVAVFAALLLTPTLAGTDRFVAKIGEPFEIDHQVYPAGTLTIKTVRDYTPGSTLNEVWVGKECLGVMLAKQDRSSGAVSERDSVEFRRSSAGHLVLVGFARAAKCSGQPRGLSRELSPPRIAAGSHGSRPRNAEPDRLHGPAQFFWRNA